MKIHALTVGALGVNCYILEDEATKEALLVDPGDEAGSILAEIEKRQLKVKYIVNTHGHADHIGANTEVKKALQVPLSIHREDADMLGDAKKNLSAFCGKPVFSPAADFFLEDSGQIVLGNTALTILHTPGHTPGGICLYTKGVLFSGDTLFAESVGRCDFPGGNMNELLAGIQKKLLILPDETVVYPGHGPATQIGWEKKHNLYLQEAQ